MGRQMGSIPVHVAKAGRYGGRTADKNAGTDGREQSREEAHGVDARRSDGSDDIHGNAEDEDDRHPENDALGGGPRLKAGPVGVDLHRHREAAGSAHG